MSDLFNYIFATHFVDNRRKNIYGEEYNCYVDKIVNKLCGERYGALYSNGYWDDVFSWGYEHSVKYILYDNKPLSKTIYTDEKENYFIFHDKTYPFLNTDSPDITINKIEKDNVCYEYLNNKYGVSFVYTYDNKEIIIHLNTNQEYNVTIYHNEEPDYYIDINTHTNKHNLNIIPHITLI